MKNRILELIKQYEDKNEVNFLIEAVNLIKDNEDIITNNESYTKSYLYYLILTSLYADEEYEKSVEQWISALDFFKEINEEYSYDYVETHELLICSLIELKKYDMASEIYKNFNDINDWITCHYLDLDGIISAYNDIKVLDKKLLDPYNNKSNILYNKASLLWKFMWDKDLSLKNLNLSLECEPYHLKSNILKLNIIDSLSLESESVIRNKYLKIINHTNNNIEIVNAYINFHYRFFGDNVENDKYCVHIYEELSKKWEKINYSKLAHFYWKMNNDKKEFESYLKGEKLDYRFDKYGYYVIWWYFEEVLNDFEKSLEYYKKYLDKNRVWSCGFKEEIKSKIEELFNKLNS
jgi:hypothetical protein